MFLTGKYKGSVGQNAGPHGTTPIPTETVTMADGIGHHIKPLAAFLATISNQPVISPLCWQSVGVYPALIACVIVQYI